MPYVVVIGVIALIVILQEISLRVVMRLLTFARNLPPRVTHSRTWVRSAAFRLRLAAQYPMLCGFVADHVRLRSATGLPLTLMILGALYLAALFSGLTEDILEANGIIHIDKLVNAELSHWQVEPLISIFLWLTALGSSATLVSAVVIATGFLWSQRRIYMIVPVWVTFCGALATTSVGKLLIGRQRPEMTIDVTVASSSFPSGHATSAMAVYGFLAYTIAGVLPSVRERFEVAYWAAVLILLVGLSRIVLGVHFLTDVIGGFMVGGIWLLVGFSIAEWNQRDRNSA